MTERKNTRLENDDPKYCKKCGARIPHSGSTTTKDGVPLAWVDADWVEIERCHNCWFEDKLQSLRWECEQRYNGELPEVLDQ